MPVTPHIWLEIDDNTPADSAPFTNDPAVWDLTSDWGLKTRDAAEVMRALAGLDAGETRRGFPARAAEATRERVREVFDAPEVTWLSAAEVRDRRPLLGDMPAAANPSVLFLLDVVELAASRFGSDRVRLIFGFF